MIPFSFGNENVKRPNVSGQFYESDPQKLSQEIETFLQRAEVSPYEKHIEIIIAPHAGYIYSAPVAAYGYKAASKGRYTTVVVMAPSHFSAFDGASIWKEGAFETPLGTIEVDKDFAEKLVSLNEKFRFDPEVFQREHALEVQLPFLQKVFSNFKIVPVILGQPKYEVCEVLANGLKQIIGDRQDVLIVVSTDMSHYHNDSFARAMDQETLAAIKELNAKRLWTRCHLGKSELCGFVPVTVALLYAKEKGLLNADILRYATSGDVSRDRNRVVGYASVIFYGENSQEEIKSDSAGESGRNTVAPLTREEKRRLLEIARKTIEEYVRTGEVLEFSVDDQRLSEEEGAFVTIHKGGALRGCIGHIIGKGPLHKTVRDMAIASATQDPRFKPLEAGELGDIDVEISVLSKPERVTDVEEIKMGVHGVIVRRGRFHQGVFLPQVATETGWSREQFLSSLCAHKAGLPADAWKDPQTILEIFSAEVFSEKDME